MINSKVRAAKNRGIIMLIEKLDSKQSLLDNNAAQKNSSNIASIARTNLLIHSYNQLKCMIKTSVHPLNYQSGAFIHQPTYNYSTSSPQSKSFSSQKPITSKNISNLLHQPKQYHYLLNILQTLKKASQSTIFNAQNSPSLSGQHINSIVLQPLKNLSQQINMFIQQLQVEKRAYISKSKWQDGDKYYRQNLLTQIQERKLFYIRLCSFVNALVKELQAVPYRSNTMRETQSRQREAQSRKRETQSRKRETQSRQSNKSQTIQKPSQPQETVISGQLFKQNFMADHSNELYDYVKQSQQDYLMRSQKLKSFNLFQLKTYESNLCVKLRLIIRVLAEVKQIYQLHLMAAHEQGIKEWPRCTSLPSLNHFLCRRIISPSEYSQLLTLYFNQFSQENLKNHLFVSIGFHSQDIAELSKELIDVKIRETNFVHDVGRVLRVFAVGQREWLFNSLANEGQQIGDKGNRQEQYSDRYGFSYSNSNKNKEEQLSSKYTNEFKSHKQHILNMAKLIINQLKTQSNSNSNSRQTQLQLPAQQAQTQHIPSPKPLQASHSAQISKHYHFMYSLTFNQLLPHRFFSISDITQLMPLIQSDIIPLMVDPFQEYKRLNQQVKMGLMGINGNMNLMEMNVKRDKAEQVQGRYEKQLMKLLREMQENMLFLTRFLQCDIHMVVTYKQFLDMFYHTQKHHLLSDLTIILNHNHQSINNPQKQSINNLLHQSKTNPSQQSLNNPLHQSKTNPSQQSLNNPLHQSKTNPSRQLQTNISHQLQANPTSLHRFLRISNILYHMLNSLNPIYIQDYITTIDHLQKDFKQFIIKDLCQALAIKPYNLLKVIDDQVLVRLVDSRDYSEDSFSASMLRFRLLTVFLDVSLITYPEFFSLLLRTTQPTQANLSTKHLASNPLLNYLYYSNGLEKTLFILGDFISKPTYQQFKSSSQPFRLFEGLIYQYQRNFNSVIHKLENIDQCDNESGIHQENKPGKRKDLSYDKGRKVREMMKQQRKTNGQQQFLFGLRVNNNKLSQTLIYYQQNDLIDRSAAMDEQVFIQYLSKLHSTIKNLNKNHNNPHSYKSQTSINSTPQTNPLSRMNFTSPINILTILSQNPNFLSSTMKMTYFNHLNSQIQQIYSFDRFVSTWNYPFSCDLAFQKRRNFKGTVDRMYIKILPNNGVRGRGRFYREENSPKRNFMRINQFNDFQAKERQFQKVQIRKKFLGTMSKDRQIIQLGVAISKSHEILPIVTEWLADQLQILNRAKVNDSFAELT